MFLQRRLARIRHRFPGFSLAPCPRRRFSSLGNTHAYYAQLENFLSEQVANRNFLRIGNGCGLDFRQLAVTLVVVAGALLGGQAVAHHAQAPFFDQDRMVEVRGTVVRWIFRNPHPILEVETTDAEGATVVWEVQFAPATLLSQRGWTDTTFQAGDEVVATGHPSKAPGTYGLEHRSLERADGSPLIR